jgi:hypothetical protein
LLHAAFKRNCRAAMIALNLEQFAQVMLRYATQAVSKYTKAKKPGDNPGWRVDCSSCFPHDIGQSTRQASYAPYIGKQLKNM